MINFRRWGVGKNIRIQEPNIYNALEIVTRFFLSWRLSIIHTVWYIFSNISAITMDKHISLPRRKHKSVACNWRHSNDGKAGTSNGNSYWGDFKGILFKLLKLVVYYIIYSFSNSSTNLSIQKTTLGHFICKVVIFAFSPADGGFAP